MLDSSMNCELMKKLYSESCVMQNRDVAKDRYIKTFDSSIMAAMQTLERTWDAMGQSASRVHHVN